jgi:hypothetical protein
MLPTVVHPALLWGLALVAAPVLIHLINNFRHRRVPWAAMEFLLTSQRKRSRWIRLKQWLLLALRMAAIAAVVLMLAQPAFQQDWASWFGGQRTHHVIVLDDSYSMGDRWGDTSAMQEGKNAIQRLGQQLANQRRSQVFTLVRFTKAGRSGRGVQADLYETPIDVDFPLRLSETLATCEPSQLDAGPAESLAAVEQMLGEPDGETRFVYLVSDFRRPQWDEPTAAREALDALANQGARLHLVGCADVTRPNLAITQLQPQGNLAAAGVPLFVELAVHNFGPQAVRNVTVSLTENGQPRPGLTFDQIPAHKTETQRFQVLFPTAGEHQLAARLQEDPLEADNTRAAVVDVPLEARVLLVDGATDTLDARFLASALSPGGSVRTGLAVQIEAPRFLNTNDLAEFETIFVANTPRLDPAAVENLQSYVEQGGGVAFFAGPLTEASFYRSLYADGQGLFPAPLEAPTSLPLTDAETIPDLDVGDHPIFRILAGQRNSFISSVAIERYFSLPADWHAPTEPTPVSVLARVRNGAPLVLERAVGQGRVIAFLTTAAPTWNNWARNPSYVVVMLELQAYLARPSAAAQPHLVGTPLSLQIDATKYQPRAKLLLPGADATAAQVLDAVPRDESLELRVAEIDRQGIYEVLLTTNSEETEARRFAFNVAPAEGDLERFDGGQLSERLRQLAYTYHDAAGFELSGQESAGSNLARGLLLLLLAMLVGEQALAFSAGYHAAPARRAA